MRVLTGLLSCVLIFSASLNAQGFLDAFSKAGPNRPPAVEDVFDPDFEMIWGEEPTGPPNGGRWNLRDKADIVQWQQAKRGFGGLALDTVLPIEAELLVIEETGGVPIPWKDTRGRVFVAIVGIPDVRITNFPLRAFQKYPAITVSLMVFNNALQRKACFAGGVPARIVKASPRLVDWNERNCEAKGIAIETIGPSGSVRWESLDGIVYEDLVAEAAISITSDTMTYLDLASYEEPATIELINGSERTRCLCVDAAGNRSTCACFEYDILSENDEDRVVVLH